MGLSRKSLYIFGLSLLVLVLTVSPAWAASGDPVPFEPDDTLQEIQQKIEQNGYAFTVKPNWVYNLPPEEKERLLSRRKSPFPKAIAGRDDIGPLAKYLGQTPTETLFTWTNYEGHSYIGPIRNQADCGSCYAFGAAAAAEGAYNLTLSLYDGQCIDFSEAFIAFCLGRLAPYSEHFDGCNGADYDYYELEALVQEGVCLEDEFPYTDVDPGECTHYDAPRVTFESWHRVPCGDINAIKTAIRNFGVVDAAVEVGSAFEAYSGGVYDDTNTACTECEYTTSNHAIALVGWDDNPPEGGGGCWILRNSWGEDWGEAGYMRIRYTAATVACAVTYMVFGEPTPSAPTVSTHVASDILSSSATLKGSVMPNGAETTCHFEYGLTTAYGSTTTSQSLGSGYGSMSVNAPISGLDQYTTYHCRLVATNTHGTTYGSDRTFLTRPDHPVVAEAHTGPAERVFQTKASFSGSFNANYTATTCHFEYGTSKSYGQTIAAREGNGEEASDDGLSMIDVSADVSSLTPGRLYHFRLVAVNAAGNACGEDQTFTTYPSGQYLQEGFEHGGAIPSGWTNQRVAGSVDWQFLYASALGYPLEPLSGDYNAFLGQEGYDDMRTRLVTPLIDLSSANTPVLFFGLAMREWGGDQDYLNVYFRSSPQDTWTLLAAFDEDVPEWTPILLNLPAKGTQCAIAFEGLPLYGYGVCIDDVAVGEPADVFRFTGSPGGGWFEEGDRLQLAVNCAGAIGEVTYQWMKDGEPIFGATDDVFEIDALNALDEGWYSCEAADQSKSIVASTPAYVHVFPEGSLPVAGVAALSVLGALLGTLCVRAVRRSVRQRYLENR